jgi:hypothetical protein
MCTCDSSACAHWTKKRARAVQCTHRTAPSVAPSVGSVVSMLLSGVALMCTSVCKSLSVTSSGQDACLLEKPVIPAAMAVVCKAVTHSLLSRTPVSVAPEPSRPSAPSHRCSAQEVRHTVAVAPRMRGEVVRGGQAGHTVDCMHQVSVAYRLVTSKRPSRQLHRTAS